MFENGGHLARIILSDVPKTGILISGKKLFTFSGGATLLSDVPKTGILIPRKQLSRFRGVGVGCLNSQWR
jgi:hypothetical protein